MAEENVKLTKIIYSAKSIDGLVDRSFSEFFKSKDPITVDRLFSIYEEIFYEIPKTGEKSHTTLIQQSQDYIDDYIDPRDDQIALQSDRIAELESQISELLVSGALDAVTPPEAKSVNIQVKIPQGSAPGNGKQDGSANQRNAKTITFKFTNAEGITTTKKLNFINIRDNNYYFRTESIPGTITYELDGELERTGKDWQFKSGIKSYTIKESDSDPVDLVLDVKPYKD